MDEGVFQVQHQSVIDLVETHRTSFSNRGFADGSFWIFGHEDALPMRGLGRRIEDIQHESLPILIEDPGLDVFAAGTGDNVDAKLLQGMVGPGQRPDHEKDIDRSEEQG